MSTEQSTAPDIIFVRDLRIDTVIGIYGWERQVTQTLVFDLEMATDIRAAAASDRIEDTLNYKAVAKRVMEFVQASRFELVESLAEHVARLILDEFQVPWLRLTLNKQGALRGARDVGLIIERRRD
ncbi:MAG: dihydroneopterin aldolase [Gammaproteobacteria bacterium]|nr:dihydroneopterin aldolase [Gammaproteobacteria bacterium]